MLLFKLILVRLVRDFYCSFNNAFGIPLPIILLLVTIVTRGALLIDYHDSVLNHVSAFFLSLFPLQ